MLRHIEELFALLRLDRRLSPRSRSTTFEASVDNLADEIRELSSALTSGDSANVVEELGDALWVVLFLIVVLEEQDVASAETVVQTAIDKLRRRKPWLESGRPPSAEEEAAIWAAAKKAEKSQP